LKNPFTGLFTDAFSTMQGTVNRSNGNAGHAGYLMDADFLHGVEFIAWIIAPARAHGKNWPAIDCGVNVNVRLGGRSLLNREQSFR
jgi:hypothetical protein